ncbi:hypothetical protein RRG08_037886 [Elysia crispata]|uniref:Uncharacterized protein n=1 Tax=Elysia crispata TaxID=231223 RepID=A0AAE0ZJP7_9GAST|nr:hypothetical protein RRG08_037886 [Elysia crispata]
MANELDLGMKIGHRARRLEPPSTELELDQPVPLSLDQPVPLSLDQPVPLSLDQPVPLSHEEEEEEEELEAEQQRLKSAGRRGILLPAIVHVYYRRRNPVKLGDLRACYSSYSVIWGGKEKKKTTTTPSRPPPARKAGKGNVLTDETSPSLSSGAGNQTRGSMSQQTSENGEFYGEAPGVLTGPFTLTIDPPSPANTRNIVYHARTTASHSPVNCN